MRRAALDPVSDFGLGPSDFGLGPESVERAREGEREIISINFVMAANVY